MSLQLGGKLQYAVRRRVRTSHFLLFFFSGTPLSFVSPPSFRSYPWGPCAPLKHWGETGKCSLKAEHFYLFFSFFSVLSMWSWCTGLAHNIHFFVFFFFLSALSMWNLCIGLARNILFFFLVLSMCNLCTGLARNILFSFSFSCLHGADAWLAHNSLFFFFSFFQFSPCETSALDWHVTFSSFFFFFRFSPCGNCVLLQHWAVNRQMRFEGGFQGRTNKLVDGCYSFWVGGLFPLLDYVLRRRGVLNIHIYVRVCIWLRRMGCECVFTK